MKPDELERTWASLEAHLARSERLNASLVAQSMARGAQPVLTRERWMLWLEIVLNYAAVVMLGSFAGDHLRDSAAAVSAGILAAALLAVNFVLLRIALALRNLDFDEPVLATQTALERLKMRRAALTAAVLIAGPLLWTPAQIVLLSMAGIDAMRALGPLYLAANAAFGIAVALGGWLAARHFAPRLRGSRWLARATDALSGGSYREAAAFLDTIARYAAEPGA